MKRGTTRCGTTTTRHNAMQTSQTAPQNHNAAGAQTLQKRYVCHATILHAAPLNIAELRTRHNIQCATKIEQAEKWLISVSTLERRRHPHWPHSKWMRLQLAWPAFERLHLHGFIFTTRLRLIGFDTARNETQRHLQQLRQMASEQCKPSTCATPSCIWG